MSFALSAMLIPAAPRRWSRRAARWPGADVLRATSPPASLRAMDVPEGRTARVDVVLDGSLTSTGGGVQSTCTLVRDGDRVIVVDPGMASGAGAILDPLARLGVLPEDVTDVVLSHHHPDHTMHAGQFPNAAVHDHWAVYRGTDWEDSECDG